jgi:nucleoside-diphosphate-sugar epimerase
VDYQEPVNIANGIETSITWVVEALTKITDYQGEIEYDSTKPNGQMRRGYNIFLAKKFLNWKPQIKMYEGLERTVEWYNQSL